MLIESAINRAMAINMAYGISDESKGYVDILSDNYINIRCSKKYLPETFIPFAFP